MIGKVLKILLVTNVNDAQLNCSYCGTANIGYDVWFGAQPVSSNKNTHASTIDESKVEDSALDILRRRFAGGEISKEERARTTPHCTGQLNW